MAKHDKHFFIAFIASLVLSAFIAVGAEAVTGHIAQATVKNSVA